MDEYEELKEILSIRLKKQEERYYFQDVLGVFIDLKIVNYNLKFKRLIIFVNILFFCRILLRMMNMVKTHNSEIY
jgi:hypothetical protein